MNPSLPPVDLSWSNYSTKDADNTPSPNKRSRITRAYAILVIRINVRLVNNTVGNVLLMIYIESLETRLRKMEALLETMQPESETKSSPDISPKEEKKDKGKESPSVEMPNSVEHNKVVRYLGSSSGYYLVRDILSTEKETIDEVRHIPNKRKQSISPENENLNPVRFKKINVLDDDVMFVRDKTLAEHVDQLETDKLDLNSNVIPKALLTQLIYKFFEMNHDTLPIVNKDDFLDSYEGRTKPPPATILVYAICTHVSTILPCDDPFFTNVGVKRDELFQTLLEHTTFLIRKEYLTPRLATIQALVLLCAYPACDKSFYRNWLRAGMAVRMAQELGLHRTLEKLALTDEMFEARKRLWYCTYITDRWCCATMGRPLAISDADCDIELPHVNGGVNGTKDYSLFINFIKLSGILGEVLRRIYSPKAKSQGYNNTSIYHTVQSIYLMLNDWNQQLPDHQRITSEEAKLIYKNKIITNKVREAGPLSICYHVVIVLLYRTFLVSNKADVLPALFEEASERCTEAAKSVVDIARLLSPTDIVRFGWNFAGYSVFQASLIHVYNCTSSQPEVAKTAREYVKICIEECIKPMNEEMNMAPQAMPLIRTLMNLIGAEKKEPERPKSPVAAPTHQYHAGPASSSYSFAPPPLQPSPMSVHAIVSDWGNNNMSSLQRQQQETQQQLQAQHQQDQQQQQQQAQQQQQQQQQDTFTTQNVSSAAWQSLFASAATPFFENETDWQNTLASLFDDGQLKNNQFML
ncbi:hypothetical protein MFLAVUS_007348 [Mucor flavus]|uniref:Xylanolytic transcriptional activator regulatory domain-containing protein n=1 Tax=Mucor flavus TaxID=439312 RepID=A0ABP9Z432_9FUNG